MLLASNGETGLSGSWYIMVEIFSGVSAGVMLFVFTEENTEKSAPFLRLGVGCDGVTYSGFIMYLIQAVAAMPFSSSWSLVLGLVIH